MSKGNIKIYNLPADSTTNTGIYIGNDGPSSSTTLTPYS